MADTDNNLGLAIFMIVLCAVGGLISSQLAFYQGRISCVTYSVESSPVDETGGE